MSRLEQLPLVLTLDAAGNPQGWVNYERSAYYYCKGLVLYALGEHDFSIYGGVSRMTGKESVLTMNTIIAIAGKISDKQHDKANRVRLTNKTLFQRDDNICAYCGDQFKIADLSRDHIKPVSKGGLNTWTNCVTSCHRCNHTKADRTPEQAGMQLLYVPYAPNKAEELILRNRKIIACQRDFLLARVPKHSRLHRN